MTVKPIPEGYHTITPYLLCDNPKKLISFLQAVFDANQVECVTHEDGTIGHAELQIGDSKLMIGNKPGTTNSAAMLYVYLNDVDAAYEKAIAAGAESIMPPKNQFYGDRNAGIKDSFGNQWWLATHVEDLTKEEIDQRAEAYYAAQGK